MSEKIMDIGNALTFCMNLKHHNILCSIWFLSNRCCVPFFSWSMTISDLLTRTFLFIYMALFQSKRKYIYVATQKPNFVLDWTELVRFINWIWYEKATLKLVDFWNQPFELNWQTSHLPVSTFCKRSFTH